MFLPFVIAKWTYLCMLNLLKKNCSAVACLCACISSTKEECPCRLCSIVCVVGSFALLVSCPSDYQFWKECWAAANFHKGALKTYSMQPTKKERSSLVDCILYVFNTPSSVCSFNKEKACVVRVSFSASDHAVAGRNAWELAVQVKVTAISPLYKLIRLLHVRIRGNWAESVSTLLKKDAIVCSLGGTGTKMAPSLCWDFKLSNEGLFVEIGQEMTKLGRKVWKKSLQSLRAELQSLRAESIAVCMQRWSFCRRSLSWESSFDWSEMKVRALPGVSPHPAVKTWPGFQIKWIQPDFSWIFMPTIPAA